MGGRGHSLLTWKESTPQDVEKCIVLSHIQVKRTNSLFYIIEE